MAEGIYGQVLAHLGEADYATDGAASRMTAAEEALYEAMSALQGTKTSLYAITDEGVGVLAEAQVIAQSAIDMMGETIRRIGEAKGNCRMIKDRTHTFRSHIPGDG